MEHVKSNNPQGLDAKAKYAFFFPPKFPAKKTVQNHLNSDNFTSFLEENRGKKGHFFGMY